MKTVMVTTLIHEISRIKLGHCKDPGIIIETENKSIQEIEAETVSFIVLNFLGIENSKSKYYVGTWNGNKEKINRKRKKINRSGR
ncbi:MAG: hypothetical protein GYA51_06815 [Candidatus Methanofastidiosa archaeon]|nr:hypothetical protein [Candidatus Methanofastidiosa archaeon]